MLIINPVHLETDEIDYELQVRGAFRAGAIGRDKTRILAEWMKREAEGAPVPRYSPFPFGEDVSQTRAKLESFEQFLRSPGQLSEYDLARMGARIACLHGRANRLRGVSVTEVELVTHVKVALNRLIDLFIDRRHASFSVSQMSVDAPEFIPNEGSEQGGAYFVPADISQGRGGPQTRESIQGQSRDSMVSNFSLSTNINHSSSTLPGFFSSTRTSAADNARATAVGGNAARNVHFGLTAEQEVRANRVDPPRPFFDTPVGRSPFLYREGIAATQSDPTQLRHQRALNYSATWEQLPTGQEFQRELPDQNGGGGADAFL